MTSPIENILNGLPCTIYLLHNLGDSPSGERRVRINYTPVNNLIDFVNEDREGLLTFDGVYENVWRNREYLNDREGILFIVGAYVGHENGFDHGMPTEMFCSSGQLQDLIDECPLLLGWHTWTHRDLTQLSDEELKIEVTPPHYSQFFHHSYYGFDYFAYPYGKFDDRVVAAVKKAGYKAAFAAGNHGDGSQFQLKRQYL